MKLYPKRGFEWAAESCVGLWCPVLTGDTGTEIVDSNLSTNNKGSAVGYANQPWVGSEFGRVLNFRTANDVFNFGRTVPTLANNHTFAGWIYPTDNADRMIAGMCDFITTGGIEWAVRSAGLSVAWFDGSIRGWFPGPSVPLNRWSFVCCVFTLTQQRLTVNQTTTIVNNTTNGIVYSNPRDQYRIGIAATNPNFLGLQAENGLWNRVLTPVEIASLASIGPGGAWQREPVRPRSYFAELLTTPNRRRSSRFLAFPG